MEVLALDPGVTTGFAIGHIHNEVLEFYAGEGKWEHRDLWQALHEFKPEEIVYEGFKYRNRQRDGLVLFSLELIGIIRLYAQINEVILKEQQPSQVMAFFTNRRLKEMNCYYVGSEHPRDATRHLLHWWTFGQGYQYHEGKEAKVVYLSA